MSTDLSSLIPVQPDQGKCQWVKGKPTGIDRDAEDRTCTIGIPHLMPGTIIFVHGVNSDGEWYRDAAEQFAHGVNARLGRDDLKPLEKENASDIRFLRGDKNNGKRIRSPIIPFYWGYAVPADKRQPVEGTPDTWVDKHGNPLRKDGSWGGGPFQNGTSSLLPFWQAGGFRKKLLLGLLDINWINPVLGREMQDCPDRLYYVHAARRLAHLVRTIREDLPNEPINIVAHSQGTMIALCALFYLDGVRGPDTVLLNSSPYRFDTAFTDFLSAAGGATAVQSEPARINTFTQAAAIIAKSALAQPGSPSEHAECSLVHEPKHKCDDAMFVHQPPDDPRWQAMIGTGEVDEEGRKWWQNPLHNRDNSGKLFVNFNPGDRVIGISAVEGMGWRGIPSRYLGDAKNLLGANVMQRMFARGTNAEHNPAPGSRTNFTVSYFYTQIDRNPVGSATEGQNWTTGSGGPLQSENEEWRYLDGKSPNTQWFIASERILGLLPALGSVSPSGPGGKSEYAYINAPVVPEAPSLGDKFDAAGVRFDGQADAKLGVEADKEQQEAFKEAAQYQSHHEMNCKPQEITCLDSKGLLTTRFETDLEVEQRRSNKVGHRVVSPTNHAQILRYTAGLAGPVANVLSYDLTIGLGYAWGDEAYWNYLLDLADWKVSDPYFKSGVLQSETIGAVPAGIDPGTVAPSDEARNAAARQGVALEQRQ